MLNYKKKIILTQNKLKYKFTVVSKIGITAGLTIIHDVAMHIHELPNDVKYVHQQYAEQLQFGLCHLKYCWQLYRQILLMAPL